MAFSAPSLKLPITPPPSTAKATASSKINRLHRSSPLNQPPISFFSLSIRQNFRNGAPIARAVEESQENAESAAENGADPTDSGVEVRDIGAEIKKAMAERKGEKDGGLLSGVAEEIQEIEWPAFGKVLGTTGVVLGVIAGSSVVLLTVNAVLAELSDRVFAGRGFQDFFG